MKKRLFIQTFGCQMNVHDSEQIIALMDRCGYEPVTDAESAGLIIVNTCSIREKAAQKIMSQLGRYRQLKLDNPRLIIGVGGCLAQHMGESLLERVPHLDLVFGTHNLHQLPDLVRAIEKKRRRIVETGYPDVAPPMGRIAPPVGHAVTAFVTIMQGCDNYCAYCVVPYLRGRETSRPWQEIAREIEMLTQRGVRDVTLLGQNVNSYGRTLADGVDFPGLLRKIQQIEGIGRIRFTTSHPKDLSDDLIRCFAELPSLCEHIHLPVQSGSDRILQAMNRGYGRDLYMERIDKLRSAVSGMAVTSDVIVGFPGETEEDFRLTLEMMDKIRFDNLFSFKYSQREGTAAVELDDKVPEAVKAERLSILQSLQESHTQARNQETVGRTVEVLVEGRSKNSPEDVSGRTRTNKIVNFRGPGDLTGHCVQVHVKKAFLHSLRGELDE